VMAEREGDRPAPLAIASRRPAVPDR